MQKDNFEVKVRVVNAHTAMVHLPGEAAAGVPLRELERVLPKHKQAHMDRHGAESRILLAEDGSALVRLRGLLEDQAVLDSARQGRRALFERGRRGYRVSVGSETLHVSQAGLRNALDGNLANAIRNRKHTALRIEGGVVEALRQAPQPKRTHPVGLVEALRAGQKVSLGGN